jgi:c-di-GMP-binding flagellar brake protein YcgR
MASNKRKNKRLGCAVPIEGKKDSSFGKTQTIDFSKGGLGIISSKRIPLNRKIAVELCLDENDDSIVAIGTVKWVRKITNSDCFRIGMEFEDVLNGTKSRLKKYFAGK